MSVVREAIVLPMLFLTVALLGGFRATLSGAVVFLQPPLAALLLGALLMWVLMSGGVLRPELLIDSHRSAAATLSGVFVVVSLFFASAQIFNLVTPEDGLLHFLFTAFFAVLLLNTLAAAPDRRHMLRSLLVALGGAFALKFIVLAALYDPAGGFAKRVLTTMLQGVTLGGLAYHPHAELTGYVAFFTVAVFVAGVTSLPAAASD